MEEKPRTNDRQTRLAEALRANLRRRREQSKRRGSGDQASTADQHAAGAEAAVNPPQTPSKPRS